MESDYITIKQAAKILGCSTQTVKKIMRRTLNYWPYKYGRKHYYRRSEVEAVVNFLKDLQK